MKPTRNGTPRLRNPKGMEVFPIGKFRVTELQTKITLASGIPEFNFRFSDGERYAIKRMYLRESSEKMIRGYLIYLGFEGDGIDDKVLVNQLLNKTLITYPVDITLNTIYHKNKRTVIVDQIQHTDPNRHNHYGSKMFFAQAQWKAGDIKPRLKHLIGEIKYWFAKVNYGIKNNYGIQNNSFDYKETEDESNARIFETNPTL